MIINIQPTALGLIGTVDIDWTAMEAIATSLSAILAAIAIILTISLFRKQALLDKRYFVLPLYTQVKKLRGVDPNDPNWDDVIMMVNTLEFIGIAYEEGLIDKRIVKKLFGSFYTEAYDNVARCRGKYEVTGKYGQEMLDAAKAIGKLNNKLKQGG